ncbi:serine/threonine protein kinase [Ktedonospora formicarum]|uniref:non-specific serine/threonine protein kinase n=1 Tax=Ktedonospora formicarum TaxID=2778364 RepID=A0A8J3I151_9CHLR|nr:serine/threonine-protein kinase [Ktedonospora formicarum]GHO44148.1 hypothetical protein KSX_23110 [Ktedonospora formicarum]
MTENGSELIGTTLGNYTLEKLIGKGGMSAVYLVQQKRPARSVAIKVLRTEAKNQANYAAFLARFQREADIIAKLEHINIIPIYEYGEQDQQAYLVMPYISGGSLSSLLAKQGRLGVHQALNFMSQAASALDYAHSQHVIHRDLKPSNFLLYPDGRLVLADFGIARLTEEVEDGEHTTLTTAGTILGTPAYMSPEALRGEAVDGRADIYALGVVFYQMLSGEIPFKGESHFAIVDKHLHETFPPLYGVHPEIPLAADAVLAKATAKDKHERYPTTGEFVKALREAVENSEAATTIRSMPDSTLPTQLASASALKDTPQSEESKPPTPVEFAQPYTPQHPPYPYPTNQPPAHPGSWQGIPQQGAHNGWYQTNTDPNQKREGGWPLALKIIPSLMILAAIVIISLQVMGAFAQKPTASQNNDGSTQTNATTPTTQPTPTSTPLPHPR